MNKMILLLIWCFTVSAVISNEDPIVNFLGGVHRLNNNSYTDYYFSCSGNGVNIQWQINDVSVNLTARDVTQDASVYTGAEFQCLAFLLSSTSSNENFYSILLVSAASDGTNFEVNCSTNSHTSNSTKITSNDSDNPLVSSMDEHILLQCLFKRNILSNTPTYFYICGVNNDDILAWQTTGRSESYDIRQDWIGKRGRIADINNTGIEVAYLIGFNKPYRLVSIFLVTGSNINVTCGSNIGGTDILCKESEPMATTESPRVTEMTTTSQDTTSATPQSKFSSTTTADISTSDPTPPTVSRSTLITIIIVIAAVLVIISILLCMVSPAVIIVVLYYIHRVLGNAYISAAMTQVDGRTPEVTAASIKKRKTSSQTCLLKRGGASGTSVDEEKSETTKEKSHDENTT